MGYQLKPFCSYSVFLVKYSPDKIHEHSATEPVWKRKVLVYTISPSLDSQKKNTYTIIKIQPPLSPSESEDDDEEEP